MTEIHKKTWPKYFQEILEGKKKFEVRLADFEVKEGDTLILEEYDPDIKKYTGVWHELIHYPSWFQKNDNYNTKAIYTLNLDGTLQVHNSTISNGKVINSYGKATVVSEGVLRVDFPIPEQVNVSKEFGDAPKMQMDGPNYVIDKLWINDDETNYIFAIVTDPNRQSLYVLSRCKNPPLVAYNQIMSHVLANYDRDRLVQTPHFE